MWMPAMYVRSFPCGRFCGFLKHDGVAKTRQLLRWPRCFDVPKYASWLTIARLAFGAFCLVILFDVFYESIK
jgi:hypothetical protein